MFERFDEDALLAFSQAQEHARSFKYRALEPWCHVFGGAHQSR